MKHKTLVPGISPTIPQDPAVDRDYFSIAERIVDVFIRQTTTPAGYPFIRPSDCRSAINALDQVLFRHRTLFRYGDSSVIDRFFSIGERLKSSQLSQYPMEIIKLNAVLADAYLATGDTKQAHALLLPIVERPYLIEDPDTFKSVLFLFAQASILNQQAKKDASAILSAVLILARLRPWSTYQFFAEFSPLLGTLTDPSSREKLAGRKTASLSFHSASLSTTRRNLIRQSIIRPASLALGFIGAASLVYEALIAQASSSDTINSYRAIRDRTLTLGRGKRDHRTRLKTPHEANLVPPPSHSPRREPLVTRAMGGIGDLLMMTPGLKALSLRLGHPIKFATKRQYHEIFANNPFVQPLDIDADRLRVSDHRWINLSICPAARYEARRRPNIRKGRVELFAKALGVSRRELLTSGTDIVINLTTEQKAFATRWLINSGVTGNRPRVGVQPFSRETYRDYPSMAECIHALAEQYDVVVFHHKDIAISGSTNFTTTAGLNLTDSFAILAEMDALVCVDSALLHAAGAFNIPVLAVFGPIDGNTRVSHLKNAVVVDSKKEFGCAPCWRNEDQECAVTRQLGTSACLTSIPVQRIIAELNAILQKRASNRDPTPLEPVPV